MSLKNDFKKRQSHNRLQRRVDGSAQLPSHRGGPVVPRGAETEDFEEFNQNPGFRVHRNRKNRIVVAQWHYTEDPDNRDPEYERVGREKNPQGWDQEMELDDHSKRGTKVFSEFSWRETPCDLGPYWSSKSSVIMPFRPPENWWYIYLATDPGRRACWATLEVLVDQYGCWHVYKSLVKPGLHYSQAKRLISAFMGSEMDYVRDHIIDPASKQRRTESMRTLQEKMAEKPNPMNVIPVDHAANEYIEIEELRGRMMRRPDGRFGLYIWNTPWNQKVIDQFKNCVYADDKGEKILSEDIDSVDALKYLATHMTGRAVRPPRPPDHMNPREYRAHLAHERLKRLHKQMRERGKANRYTTDESYTGPAI